MKIVVTPLAGMPAADFGAWLDHVREYRRWGTNEVAARFGVAPNTIRNWREGGAPGYIGLACHALLKGMTPWHPKKEES